MFLSLLCLYLITLLIVKKKKKIFFTLLIIKTLPIVEPPQIEITNNCPVTYIGNINKLHQTQVIVKSVTGTKPLDEGTILCFEDKTLLGKVCKVHELSIDK